MALMIASFHPIDNGSVSVGRSGICIHSDLNLFPMPITIAFDLTYPLYFLAKIHRCQPIRRARGSSMEREMNLPKNGIHLLLRNLTAVPTLLKREKSSRASLRV